MEGSIFNERLKRRQDEENARRRREEEELRRSEAEAQRKRQEQTADFTSRLRTRNTAQSIDNGGKSGINERKAYDVFEPYAKNDWEKQKEQEIREQKARDERLIKRDVWGEVIPTKPKEDDDEDIWGENETKPKNPNELYGLRPEPKKPVSNSAWMIGNKPQEDEEDIWGENENKSKNPNDLYGTRPEPKKPVSNSQWITSGIESSENNAEKSNDSTHTNYDTKESDTKEYDVFSAWDYDKMPTKLKVFSSTAYGAATMPFDVHVAVRYQYVIKNGEIMRKIIWCDGGFATSPFMDYENPDGYGLSNFHVMSITVNGVTYAGDNLESFEMLVDPNTSYDYKKIASDEIIVPNEPVKIVMKIAFGKGDPMGNNNNLWGYKPIQDVTYEF